MSRLQLESIFATRSLSKLTYEPKSRPKIGTTMDESEKNQMVKVEEPKNYIPEKISAALNDNYFEYKS